MGVTAANAPVCVAPLTTEHVYTGLVDKHDIIKILSQRHYYDGLA